MPTQAPSCISDWIFAPKDPGPLESMKWLALGLDGSRLLYVLKVQNLQNLSLFGPSLPWQHTSGQVDGLSTQIIETHSSGGAPAPFLNPPAPAPESSLSSSAGRRSGNDG